MSWLKTSEERQAGNVLENPHHPLAQPLMFMDGERTKTGRTMNEGRALSIAALYNAVTVISGTLATIPLKVYRRLDNGGREEEQHALTSLLGLSPSPQMTSTSWREAGQAHVLLRGNTFSEVRRDGAGRVTELVPYSPLEMVRKGAWYRIDAENRKLGYEEVLHIAGPGGNGVDGWSVIKLARESWGLSSALEESNAVFIGKGTRPSGLLTTESSMKPETLTKLRELFGRRVSGLDNVGSTIVLDGGFSWQPISLTAEDSQFMQSRQFSVTEIARWFNISPHLIKDLERGTFSNIEQLAIEFVQHTLRPWAVRWEQAMNMRLLTERERNAGLFIAFNLDGLLRGDAQARAESLNTQYNAGALTINEWRALENRNPVDGGDEPRVRRDTVALDEADVVQTMEPDAGSDEDERTETNIREFRSPDLRLQLRASFGPVLLEGAQRMVRGEMRNIRRIVKPGIDPNEFRERVEAYYFDDHPTFAMKAVGTGFRSYADAVAMAARDEINGKYLIDAAAYADLYANDFVARYSARSRRELTKLEPEQVEQRLAGWETGYGDRPPRHEQIVSREVVKLGDAVARQVFIASGILSLVWRTVGDTCPYCRRLNGKVVGSTLPFIAEGEEFTADGAEGPLVPKYPIRHAPAHRGCDCTIAPGV